MMSLREKTLEAMRQRGYSPRTQSSYVDALKDLARFSHQPPDRLDDEQIQAYFRHLVLERKLAASSCHLHLSALRFLHRAVLGEVGWDLDVPLPKRGGRIPELLSIGEVGAILDACANPKHQMALRLCYGCGLRVSEVGALKVRDIDGPGHLLRINQSKGDRDLYVLLSETLLDQLRGYWQRYRPHEWLIPGKTRDTPLHITALQRAYGRARHACVRGVK